MYTFVQVMAAMTTSYWKSPRQVAEADKDGDIISILAQTKKVSLDQKNIQLLIAHKEQELKTLQEEWREASYYSGDMDYEYLALLYPIIAGLEREIARFRELAAKEYAGELYFLPYIQQLLNGECQRLEMHIDFGRGAYTDFAGPLMIFDKGRQKYGVIARVLQHDWLESYLHKFNFSRLYQLGWRQEGKKAFKLKHFIRNENDLMQFHSLIACTFMEPLSHPIEAAKKQYLVVIPSETSH